MPTPAIPAPAWLALLGGLPATLTPVAPMPATIAPGLLLLLSGGPPSRPRPATLLLAILDLLRTDPDVSAVFPAGDPTGELTGTATAAASYAIDSGTSSGLPRAVVTMVGRGVAEGNTGSSRIVHRLAQLSVFDAAPDTAETYAYLISDKLHRNRLAFANGYTLGAETGEPMPMPVEEGFGATMGIYQFIVEIDYLVVREMSR